MARLVSSKHLESVSDLTLTAPIKQGFIDAFEAVTYETRLSKILEALFKIRSTAREYSKIKPFVDSAERIQSLLDYRLAILDDCEPHRLLLSATFDKPFEPYMRLIWNPLGPLLDVIFCNCEGYVTATGHGFPQYLDWVRRSQVDTNFFYSANGLSVGDIDYLLNVDRLQRESCVPAGPGDSPAPTPQPAIRIPDPEVVASDVRKANVDATDQLGMEALVSLYRLTDFYPPDSSEGAILRRATQQLLKGWAGKQPRADAPALEWLIRDQLAWFRQDMDGTAPIPAATPEPVDKRWLPRETELIFKPGDIQGGILTPYGNKDDPVRTGALLLMRIMDAAKARAFIAGLDVQTEGGAEPTDNIFRNLAFTCRGLLNIGVPGVELESFPQEFREGMEERAGLLGDVRDSHPRNWKLPERNWPGACRAGAPRLPVDMSEIDLVIQLRTTDAHDGDDIIGDSAHPLHAEVQSLADAAKASGVQLLAVQPMRRADTTKNAFGREHFGFMDGISQPAPVGGSGQRKPNEVARGELLLGYANDRGDAAPSANDILDNGTFLVVRKLRQDVGALRKFVADNAATGGIAPTLYGRMMGRTPDGVPMLTGGKLDDNSFNYVDDAPGQQCPFQAHVRRSNPRASIQDAGGRPTPRILRRGLSYGPGLSPDQTDDDGAERGVVFMAYNASIAEQYEVIQRWVNGGNSTGIPSWHNDPIMGGPQDNGPRVFYFTDDSGQVVPLVLPSSFVELQWGMYLFVPSMKAIEAVIRSPEAPTTDVEVARGRTIIEGLQKQAADGDAGRRAAAAAWKVCLEDFGAKDPAEKAEAQAVWAAIRDDGGALRIPYGPPKPDGSLGDVVLVASKELVMTSLEDPNGVYSMRGHMERMKESFGEIFLGMDRNDPNYNYAIKSAANGPISEISEQEAFAVARQAANKYLKGLQGIASSFPGQSPPPGQPQPADKKAEIDLRREFITDVLAGICNHYFGIPDALPPASGQYVDPRGWGWEKPGEGPGERHPRCPGDFMAPSRYCFYPDPVRAVRDYGQQHGQALQAAVARYLTGKLGPDRSGTLPGRLSNDIATLKGNDNAWVYGTFDELASTIVGVMTGFLPPADGCMRWALYEWIQEKTLWRVQQDLLSHPDADPFVRAQEALRPWLARAMQKRPAPDILWRTVTGDDELGNEKVKAGDKIVIGLVSALAEDAAISDIPDIYPVFGGNRAPTDGSTPPVHACPGYHAAMGVMLGMLSALLENCGIETLPAPLLVRLSFDIAKIDAEIAAAEAAAQAAAEAAAAAAAAGGSGG